MYPFLNIVKSTIEKHQLLPENASVLVGCSGGPDSVALALVLRELGYHIALAHVNYGLRAADSDGDEVFVRELAKDWKVDLFVKQADAKLLKMSAKSLQAEARSIRYQFFQEILSDLNWDYCATGHTYDDQAETIWRSRMRGAGPKLMHDIPACRLPYVRPMLGAKRKQVLAYLEDHEQAYRTDHSNDSDAYLRNRIRNTVMPSLVRINPGPQGRLIGQYQWYEQESALLNQVLAPYREAAASGWLDWRLFINEVGEQHLPLFLRHVLADWGITGPAAEAAAELVHRQPGTGLDMPGKGKRLQRHRHGIACQYEILPDVDPVSVEETIGTTIIGLGQRKVSLEIPYKGPLNFSEPNVHFLDITKLIFPLIFRGWKQADRMIPLGMKGSKLLSDIFIDEQFSPNQKAQAIIVEDQSGIISLSEFRIAESVKITENTIRFARLTFL